VESSSAPRCLTGQIIDLRQSLENRWSGSSANPARGCPTSRAIHPRPCLHRQHARLGWQAGDLLDQLGASRLLELFALLDRDDKGSGPADHAVFVVNIKVRNAGTGTDGPAQHDWQPVNGDARRQHVIAHDGDRWPHIIGSVTGNIDDAAQTTIAARFEQRFGKLQSPEDRGARRAPIGGALDFIGDLLGGLRAIDQPPWQNDFLVI
jgi:hypothetical protein